MANKEVKSDSLPSDSDSSILTTIRELATSPLASMSMEEKIELVNRNYEDLETDLKGRKVKEIIDESRKQVKTIYQMFNLIVHDSKLKNAQIEADQKDLSMAEKLLAAQSVKNSRFSRISDPNMKFIDTTFGKGMIISVLTAIFFIFILWYNDQQLISGLS